MHSRDESSVNLKHFVNGRINQCYGKMDLILFCPQDDLEDDDDDDLARCGIDIASMLSARLHGYRSI